VVRSSRVFSAIDKVILLPVAVGQTIAFRGLSADALEWQKADHRNDGLPHLQGVEDSF
jgi:hypothetical protein